RGPAPGAARTADHPPVPARAGGRGVPALRHADDRQGRLPRLGSREGTTMRRSTGWIASSLVTVALLLAACAAQGPAGAPAAAPAGLARIQHIVVIYLENHSFDNLYGLFPGADGVAQARPEQATQVDHDGTPLPALPPVWTADGKRDPRFPTPLPNRPFLINGDPIRMGT